MHQTHPIEIVRAAMAQDTYLQILGDIVYFHINYSCDIQVVISSQPNYNTQYTLNQKNPTHASPSRVRYTAPIRGTFGNIVMKYFHPVILFNMSDVIPKFLHCTVGVKCS